MKLIDAIKTDFSNVNNLGFERSHNIDQSKVVSEINPTKIDRVEINSISNSNLSVQLTTSTSKISNLQVAQNSISKMINTINSFESLISSNKNNLDSVQPQIQNTITTFNSNSNNLLENMSSIIEEKQNDNSRVYFDGILGSKPISGEEIYKAISEQKQKLEQYSSKLTQELEQVTQQAQNTITMEKSINTSNENFFANVNFEQESISFAATNVQDKSGSIVQTQANAEPHATTKLVSAS